MKKVVVEAPSNLAFVKYWGKINSELNIPYNSSISVNLSNAKTTTTIQFDEDLKEDEVVNASGKTSASFSFRITNHLNRIRSIAKVDTKARVFTQNTFPTGVGIASSASGFAALTLASITALDLKLSEKELSSLSRLGSGSACRSIPNGFVEWRAGSDNDTSYAVSIAQPNYWDISILSVVVTKKEKEYSSTDGHALSLNSPFFEARMKQLPERLNTVRKAILEKDFDAFGREIEIEAISMHSIAMTAQSQNMKSWISGIYYWIPETLELIKEVQKWRSEGLRLYFTLDAGPTVHLVCETNNMSQVKSAIDALEKKASNRTWDTLINFPTLGARVLKVEPS